MKHYYILILATVFSLSTYGQSWPLTAKLETNDQETNDNHAYSVGISGQYAVAGAYMEDHDGTGGSMMTNSGSAYVYKYDSTNKTWSQEAKLVAADRSASAFFGYSVAIDGTYIVVGAPQDSVSSGAAYVYERNGSGTWVQVKKMVATSRRASDRFGISVDISGDNIIVGAHHEDEDESDANTLSAAGSAYVYERDGTGAWNFDQKIVASDRSVNDEFGISVAIDGTRILVGAYRQDADTALKEKGAAYAFKYASGMWSQEKILQATDRFEGDEFGWSVDVSGDYHIVGAPKHNLDSVGANGKLNSGAAYIFDANNSWAESKVVATDRADQDNYGQSVAISGDWGLVGAHLQNFGPPGETPPVLRSDGGAAYVIKRGTTGIWTQEKKLIADVSDRFAGDKLGFSVDIDGEELIVGAPEDNVDSSAPVASSGSAYVFRKDTTTVNISKYNIDLPVSIYPNPAYDIVSVAFGATIGELTIYVSDMQGKVLNKYEYRDTEKVQFNISHLPAGSYLLQIHAPDIKTTDIKLVKY